MIQKRLGLAAASSAVWQRWRSSPARCSGGARRRRGGAHGGKYTIGFANAGGVGNGWREAMLCSAKAQAVKAGNVSKVTVIHHDTDAAGQLADIRT